MELNSKQKHFCELYVGKWKFNGQQAATEAGYSAKTAGVTSSQLLKLPKVADYVDKLKKDLSALIGVTARDIALEYKKVGFFNINDVLDENGVLKKVTDFTADACSAITMIETFEHRNLEGKVTGQTRKVRLNDKIGSLDKLSKMLGFDGISKTAIVDSEGNDIKPDYSKLTNEELAMLAVIQKKLSS